MVGMGDLYVFKPGDSEEWKARREAAAAEQRLVRTRWTARVADEVGLTMEQAERVMAVLFDHGRDGEDDCPCGCHPRFDTLHDGGFDCPCTWSRERRAESRAKLFEALAPTPEMLAAESLEEAELTAWFGAHPGVAAKRTCFAAPEVWEGSVDGRSFYFRERHGEWRIEIDLAPDGHFAQRYVGTNEDGEMITDAVELTSGTEIARGLESDLGTGAVEHLDFIVRRVREFIRGETCTHPGARQYCPDCGTRIPDS